MSGGPRHLTQASQINALWAHLLLEELCRLGVRHLCIAPGSRSAPLTLAAAEQPGLQCHTHFDERGLGFFALGLAQGLNAPVALLTTSGTAVANLYPAVVEARQSGMPLWILSADRPLELIDVGANQAIPQTGIFAHYPIYQQDLPAPSLALSPRFLLASLDEAARQQALTPGPVHLNCRFPEPLYPQAAIPDWQDYLAPLGSWLDDAAPWQRTARPQPDLSAPDWPAFCREPGLIVAGRLTDPGEAESIRALARTLGWPLLADIQSQLRFAPEALPLYDLALHHAGIQAALGQAKVLLQLGGRLVSKRLSQFIARQPWQQAWLIDRHGARLDENGPFRVRQQAPVGAWCQARLSQTPAQAPWLDLTEPLTRLGQGLDAHLPTLSEAALCRRLPRVLRGQLLLGNSLPIRLLNSLAGTGAGTGDGPSRVLSNRGASGIDGLIATAAGWAHSHPHEPTTLLLGDTSALHDLNSLALLRDLPGPFVLLLINNDGGSIFHLLPVPEAAKAPFYRLPHGLDFAQAAGQFGLCYQAPDNLDAALAAYRQALDGGQHLIEIKVPHDEVANQLNELKSWIQAQEWPLG